jgi:hypothetical protein
MLFPRGRCVLVVVCLSLCGCPSLWDRFLAERDMAVPDGGETPDNTMGTCPTAQVCWFNPLPQGNRLYAVHALSDREVWAVGTAGTILRWDGKTWSGSPSGLLPNMFGMPALRDVWALDSQNVWAAGDSATIVNSRGDAVRRLAYRARWRAWRSAARATPSGQACAVCREPGAYHS